MRNSSFVAAVFAVIVSANSVSARGFEPFAAPDAVVEGPKATPFANSDSPPPPDWKGPLFALSHDYPSRIEPFSGDPPWRAAIGGGRISATNAGAYVAALKRYISEPMRIMLLRPDSWDPQRLGWYNEPWLGAVREPIHGMYVGSSDFPAALFWNSGLQKDFTTYVLTYYDRRAATSLYRTWGTSAMNPVLRPGPQQFDEDAIVVKAAFTTANSDNWPVMEGALEWPLYIKTNATNGTDDKSPRKIDTTSFMQFDIIVKDTRSAPATGWVFATLVYDKNAPGNDVWDKMVPLGAMWGNDPDAGPAGPLKENWINPSAPAYSKTTLGWRGALSGPNDAALNNAYINPNGPPIENLASSSCMSCHGSAQWPFKSFLLPTTSMPPKAWPTSGQNAGAYLLMQPVGSPGWMTWFQDRPGSIPQDAGATAFDYDMVYVFKSLPAWQKATTGSSRLMSVERSGRIVPGGNYNGLPFGGSLFQE